VSKEYFENFTAIGIKQQVKFKNWFYDFDKVREYLGKSDSTSDW